MAKQIVLTKTAILDLKKIVQYLLSEFGVEVSNKFLARFDEVCATIANNPSIYPMVYEKRNTRKGVIKKQCLIYYRVYPEHIEVIRLFDTRQNPGKLHKL